MQIQVRESKKNSKREQFCRVKGMLTHSIPQDDIRCIVWSFECEDTRVLHSGNAEQTTFLNYANPESPVLEILLPEVGTYSIRLVAHIEHFVEKEIDIVSLDENNQPITNKEMSRVLDTEEIKSPYIDISWDNTDDGWV